MDARGSLHTSEEFEDECLRPADQAVRIVLPEQRRYWGRNNLGSASELTAIWSVKRRSVSSAVTGRVPLR